VRLSSGRASERDAERAPSSRFSDIFRDPTTRFSLMHTKIYTYILFSLFIPSRMTNARHERRRSKALADRLSRRDPTPLAFALALALALALSYGAPSPNVNGVHRPCTLGDDVNFRVFIGFREFPKPFSFFSRSHVSLAALALAFFNPIALDFPLTYVAITCAVLVRSTMASTWHFESSFTRAQNSVNAFDRTYSSTPRELPARSQYFTTSERNCGTPRTLITRAIAKAVKTRERGAIKFARGAR